MRMNERFKRLLIALIAIGGAVSCTLYEHTEIEEIHPPQIEQDSIIVPDWDTNTDNNQ